MEFCNFLNINSFFHGGSIFIDNINSHVHFVFLSFYNCNSLNNYSIDIRQIGGGAFICNVHTFSTNCLIINKCSGNGEGSGFYSKVLSFSNHHYNNTIITNIPKIGRHVCLIDQGNIISFSINSTKSMVPYYSGIVFGSKYKCTLILKYLNSNENIDNSPFHGSSTNDIGNISFINIINNTIFNSSSKYSIYLVGNFFLENANFVNNYYIGHLSGNLIIKNSNTDLNLFFYSNYTHINCKYNFTEYPLSTLLPFHCSYILRNSNERKFKFLRLIYFSFFQIIF